MLRTALLRKQPLDSAKESGAASMHPPVSLVLTAEAAKLLWATNHAAADRASQAASRRVAARAQLEASCAPRHRWRRWIAGACCFGSRPSWRRPSSRSRSPAARPLRDRDRSERRECSSRADDVGDAPSHNYRPTDRGRALRADVLRRPERAREDCHRSANSYPDHPVHSATARDPARKNERGDDQGDRRSGTRRAVEECGRRARWHDAMGPHAPSQPSDWRAASHRHDDGRGEWRGRQDVAPQQDDRKIDRAELRGNRMAHQIASLSSARAEARHEHRPPVGDRGGRPRLPRSS